MTPWNHASLTAVEAALARQQEELRALVDSAMTRDLELTCRVEDCERRLEQLQSQLYKTLDAGKTAPKALPWAERLNPYRDRLQRRAERPTKIFNWRDRLQMHGIPLALLLLGTTVILWGCGLPVLAPLFGFALLLSFIIYLQRRAEVALQSGGLDEWWMHVIPVIVACAAVTLFGFLTGAPWSATVAGAGSSGLIAGCCGLWRVNSRLRRKIDRLKYDKREREWRSNES